MKVWWSSGSYSDGLGTVFWARRCRPDTFMMVECTASMRTHQAFAL
jgi:hypothetical protein